MGCLLQVFLTT